MAAVRVEVAPLAGEEPTDLDAVVRVESSWHGTDAWTRGVFLTELARHDRIYLVVREGGEVVGFGGIALLAGDAHVMRLAVDPAARRRGHGERLVRALVEAATRAGVRGVTLEVQASNAAAQRLYRRVGFAVEGMRPRYYPNGEDAVIMWLRPEANAASTATSGG